MAMYLSVFVLGIFGVSASAAQSPAIDRFKYVHSLHRRANLCNICYGDDCLPLDQSRCDYYTQANNLLIRDDEDPEGFLEPKLQNDVNSLIFDMAEKMNQYPEHECIPYISRYTDCTKENICLGCQTCHCSNEGKWNCSALPCYIQPLAVDVDHRVLITTIENLAANTKFNRGKRSVTTYPFEKTQVSTITLKQLSDWMYEMTPDYNHDIRDETINTEPPNDEEISIARAMEQFNNEQPNPEPVNVEVITNSSELPLTESSTSSTTEPAIRPLSEYTEKLTSEDSYAVTTDSEYLAFDEVLSNIAIDTKNYSRRKPPLDILPSYNPVIFNKTQEFDYMLLDDYMTTDMPNTDTATEMSYIVNFIQQNDGTERPLDEATKVVIDLLESAKKVQIFNDTDYADINPNKDDLVGVGFDNTNDIFDYNAVNIMKRDIAGVTDNTKPKSANDTYVTITNIINSTDTENKTSIPEDQNNLKNKVLLPLVQLINRRRDELDDLKKIKENLIRFMNYYNESPIVEIIDYPNISASNALHDIEMFPDLGYDLRRTNTHIMRKFLFKLKADIHEVIKDIIGLERYREGKLPDDLSLLISSLKRYVSESGSHSNQHKHSKTIPKLFVSGRRNMKTNNYKCLESTFKQCIIEIFQTVDRDMPKYNALGALSPNMRKILRHVIKTYNNDELASIAYKVHDPDYNMTNDLKSVGSGWQDMSNNAIGSSPHEIIYKMKLLHYFLERDINKINDALALIDFARSRRMIPFFKSINSDILEQINKGLNSIHNDFEIIIKYRAKSPRYPTDFINYRPLAFDEYPSRTLPEEIKTEISDKQKHKKLSFIKQIRNLLKSSKRDIGELLHRHVPKSEIVKQLAKQKLNEIAQKRYYEYEAAMKKWQNNLGVLPMRYKRYALDQVSNRIKSIIPKYLRNKVHSPLHEKKKNGSRKHNKITITTATTPRTKTTKKTRTTKKSYKSAGTTKKTKKQKSMKKTK